MLAIPGVSPLPPYTAGLCWGLCWGIVCVLLPDSFPLLIDSCTLDLVLYSWYIVFSLNVTVDLVRATGLRSLKLIKSGYFKQSFSCTVYQQLVNCPCFQVYLWQIS